MTREPLSPNPGLLPKVRLPDPGIYQRHGEATITALVETVYQLLARSPIAGMFPADPAALQAAARKSALFWITACGGPPLYEERHGPPRMKARHLPFAIGQAERDHWVACWDQVLDQAPERFGLDQAEAASLRHYVHDFSLWMINQ